MLMMTMKKYDYIFGIVMGLWENCEFMLALNSQKDKERQRKALRDEIEEMLDEEKVNREE